MDQRLSKKLLELATEKDIKDFRALEQFGEKARRQTAPEYSHQAYK